MSEEVVIVGFLRTPFSKFGGVLKDFHSTDLAAHVIKGVIEKVGIGLDEIDELYYGTALPAESALLGNIPSRQAALKAGLPLEQVATTYERACCSSMTALRMAYRSIKHGYDRIALVSGTENMGNVPLLLGAKIRWGTGLSSLNLFDCMYEIGYKGYSAVAVDTAEVALENGIGREEQDKWAFRSQQRYAAALEKGKWADEVLPISVNLGRKGTIVVDQDECPKPQTTLEKLSKIPTIYGSATCTAGNAPGVDAGASAMIIMSATEAARRGIRPLAKIITAVGASTNYKHIASVPALTIRKALDESNLPLEDMGLIEINEAFAAMPLVSTHILGNGIPEKVEELRDRTNVNGGCVAMGHPVGASGLRIVGTMLNEMIRSNTQYGVASICGGLGQGEAVIIQSI